MSDGGTIKAQLESVTKELEEEYELWSKEKLPPTATIFRMGDSEFQHHCHVEALTRIVRDILQVSQEQMDLIYRGVVLQELRTQRLAAVEVRAQMRRAQITRGIRPPGNGEVPRI